MSHHRECVTRVGRLSRLPPGPLRWSGSLTQATHEGRYKLNRGSRPPPRQVGAPFGASINAAVIRLTQNPSGSSRTGISSQSVARAFSLKTFSGSLNCTMRALPLGAEASLSKALTNHSSMSIYNMSRRVRGTTRTIIASCSLTNVILPLGSMSCSPARRAAFVRVGFTTLSLKLSRNTVRKVIRTDATGFIYDRTTQTRTGIDPGRSALDAVQVGRARRSDRERRRLVRIHRELRNRGGCGAARQGEAFEGDAEGFGDSPFSARP